MPLKQATSLAFAAVAALVLSGCGGGDGSSAVNRAPGSYTVETGLAQKGPLVQGSQITINELSFSNFQPSGRSFDFEVTNNLGTFNPSGISFSSPYLSTTAQGYYFNELTGLPSTDMVFLRGLSDVYVGGDTTINVNVLSNFSKNRILNLATGKNLLNPATGAAAAAAPMQFLKARAQAQAENLKAFYIYNSASILSGTTVGGVAQPANFTALDLGKSSVPVSGSCVNSVCSNVVALVPIAGNQILAAVSALVMKAGSDGDGVNTLLSQIEADFADDGLLNNSPQYAQSVKSRLCAAAASTDFAKVASNLNAFYGTNYQATDLSQWVDTSGCVDQVIDKFKFSAINVAAGTVSKSPAYVAGPDDVGQCFSIGGVSPGAATGLYYNGASMPVTGTQIVKLGDSLSIGINANGAGNYSGFIQRNAPAVNGACQGNTPSSALVRVLKYAVTASSTPSAYASFSGASSVKYYSGINSALPIGNSSRTVQAVIRTNQSSTNTCCGGSIFNYGTASYYERFGLLVNVIPNFSNSGSAYFCGNFVDISTEANTANDGNWHVITVTYNGSNVSIYIDGILKATNTNSPIYQRSFSDLNTNGNVLTIGSDGYNSDTNAGPSELFVGDISRVTVWNTALTSSQVTSISAVSTNFPVSPVSSFLFTGKNNPPSTVTDSLNPNIRLQAH